MPNMLFSEFIRLLYKGFLLFISFFVGKRLPFEDQIFSSPSLWGVCCLPVSGQTPMLIEEGHTAEREGRLSFLSACRATDSSYSATCHLQTTRTSQHFPPQPKVLSHLCPSSQDSLTFLSTTQIIYPQDRRMTNNNNGQMTEVSGDLGSGQGEGILFVGMGRDHVLEDKISASSWKRGLEKYPGEIR